jgi:hypothetical protein
VREEVRKAIRAERKRRAADPAAPLPEIENRLYEMTPPEERTGIALFPPPGTDPPKRGIVVPDHFELPPGYMRHYQSTDGGEALAPILMFHPDYEFVDGAGRPVTVPADRVVPPEMVPPGLPIRMLDIPDPAGGRDRAP